MTHTKEPWAVSGTEIVCAADESHIGEVPHGGSPDQDAADRARIVSCVNAMQGIPDPAAYVKAMGEVVEKAEMLCDPDIPAGHGRWNDLRTALATARAAMGERT